MKQQILVVDDDEGMREIVAFALMYYGYLVNQVEDGQQLNQQLAKQLPDLIILDVVMPGEDGYQIFRRLRKDPVTRHIPVMIITAHVEGIYKRISDDLGVAKHMTKPFHPLVLVEGVRAILRESKEKSQNHPPTA